MASEQASVQSSLLIDFGGQSPRWYSQRPQESVQRLRGGEPLGRLIAMQVDVELSVGEARRKLVGDVHRQGSFAHPCHAGDG